jgi:superfamily II DNA or RNA helicase
VRPSHKVLYLLYLSNDRQLSLSPVRAPLAGIIGEVSPLPLSLIRQETQAPYLAEADFEILHELAERCELIPGLTWYPLPASAGSLLEKVLATGRGRWEDENGPLLKLEEPLCAAVEWRLLDTGEQVLRFKLPSGSDNTRWRHLPLIPPWVVDSQSGACRPVKASDADEADVIDALGKGPISVAEAGRLLAEIRASEVRLPEPALLSVDQLASARPQVIVRLRNVDIGRGGRFIQLPAVALGFAYGSEEFPWHFEGNTRLIRSDHGLPDRVLEVCRDREFEGECLARLEMMGLKPLSSLHGSDYHPEDSELLVSGEGEWSLTAWASVQRALHGLQDQGWSIHRDQDLEAELLLPDGWRCRLAPAQGEWVRVDLEAVVGDQAVSVLQAIADWVRDSNPMLLQGLHSESDTGKVHLLRLGRRYLVEISSERLLKALDALVELNDPGQTFKAGSMQVRRGRLADLATLAPEWALVGDDELAQVAHRLDRFEALHSFAEPEGLRATLRDYQRQGLAWLQFLRETGFGGILADDMGLGKTVQTLAHVLVEQQTGRLDRPALVVAPTSLMFNWRAEAKRFAPALRVLTLHGPERRGQFQWIPDSDLVLTTYPLLSRDMNWLEKHRWHIVILDEAQAIKNPRTRAARAARKLDTRHRLCLTGTPMENHLGELWSQFDFLMPGLLGSDAVFKAQFRQPIENHGNEERRAVLARRIRPFFLRRTKSEVAPELPPKTEIVRSVPLTRSQDRLYQAMREEMQERIRVALRSQGPERGRIVILDALLRLRQICCDPRLTDEGQGAATRDSAKLSLLMELLPEMVVEGRRILLFSQFVRMLELIEVELVRRGIDFVKLTGQTKDRQKVIEAFQRGQAPVFLISLRAGGVGLNLTEADTVIHYDPWWNPAVEDQATDRAHRIGQERKVFVYRLLTEDTIEERVQRLQASKRELIDGLLGGGGAIDLGPEELSLLLGSG